MNGPFSQRPAWSRAGQIVRRLLWLIVFLAMLRLLFYWFERFNVYQPWRRWATDGSVLGRPWTDMRFKASDGVELSGWFFPADATSAHRHLAVLVCHGNGGNISHRLSLYRMLLDSGLNVFTFDYRGYGRSGGRASEPGTYLDAEAALASLGQHGFPEGHVIALGESLGGGIASELARRHPGLGGLVLQSAFTSIPDIGADLFPWLPVRRLATILYDTRSKLPAIPAPVLILHSREDTLIPFRHAEANFAAAREPKLFREIRGNHNDQPDSDVDGYVEALRDFLAMLARIAPDP